MQVWYNNLLFGLISALIISGYLKYNQFLLIDPYAAITYSKASIINHLNFGMNNSNYKISAKSFYGTYSNNIRTSKILSHPFFIKKFEYAKATLISFS